MWLFCTQSDRKVVDAANGNVINQQSSHQFCEITSTLRIPAKTMQDRKILTQSDLLVYNVVYQFHIYNRKSEDRVIPCSLA